jgi:hypothetical protein
LIDVEMQCKAFPSMPPFDKSTGDDILLARGKGGEAIAKENGSRCIPVTMS